MKVKKIFHNNWVSLYITEDGYVFSHEERCGGKLVAVLGFRKKNNTIQFLGRFEKRMPITYNLRLCSLTGGVEDNNIELTAIKELKEEAGIIAKKESLIDLGTVQPLKSSDAVVYLFGVDLTGIQIGIAEGDGSEGEKGAYSNWVSYNDIINCDDPLVHTMLLRLHSRGYLWSSNKVKR